MMSEEDLHRRCVEWYGREAQYDKVVEECAELTLTIMHHKLGRLGIGAPAFEHIANEAVDVEITLRALRLVIGPEIYDAALRAKLARLQQRLDVFEAKFEHERQRIEDEDEASAERLRGVR